MGYDPGRGDYVEERRELFRAFVVAARERYEIARDARAYRRALGQEQ